MEEKYVTYTSTAAEYFENQRYTTVYKFRDWSIDYHRRVLDGSFYLSSPTQFNDPFDLSIPVAYELLRDNPDLQRQYFVGLVDRHKSSWKPHQKAAEVDRLINEGRFKDDKWLEWQTKYHDEQFAQVGVFCFSQNKTEILSWSHYSNSHRGFCLGFDAKALFKEMFIAHGIGGTDVKYEVDYPSISPVSSFEAQFKTQLSCKSKKWEYEEEVRLFRLFGAKKVYEVPTSLITEINLGCNISDEDRNQIIDLARNKLPHAKIYQAAKVRGKFELGFAEL